MEITLNDGKKIELHSFKKGKKECVICGNKGNLHNHHVSYEKDLACTLCLHHHNLVHKHKKHPLYPIDERQQLIIKLNVKNSKNLKLFFKDKGYNINETVNRILETRLEDGKFCLTRTYGKKYCDIVSWSEFKKIAGSFFLKDPNLIHKFLDGVFYNFNSNMNRRVLADEIIKFLKEYR